LFDSVGARLTEMGHTVNSVNGGVVGGVQIIMYVPEGHYYRAGSDFRKDGEAVGW
jgi:gamma-glutamyltranspeptidase/glutathione hydrolase